MNQLACIQSQRNKVTALLRQAKSNFITAQNQDLSKPRLQKLIGCLRRSPSRAVPDLTTHGQTLPDPTRKATALNEFFVEQSRRSVQGSGIVPSLTTNPNVTTPLTDLSTSEEEVVGLLKQLDAHKSPGHDGIPTRVLKEAASELAPSLCHLFNLSLSHAVLPQDWRDATVTPIFKKGNPHLPANYRPICLLSVTSKILERIVHARLYSHVSQYLPHHQSGFRCHNGTELQLARLYHDISARRDEGQAVIACFFDLSKAFDRVWHQGLLHKLQHDGVRGQALAWITAYLAGRRQRVQVDGSMSEWLPFPAGVPQGSVLGPLLFLAYTIDLPDACTNSHTSCSQFANDTALIASSNSFSDSHHSLQDAGTAAATWLSTWHLLVNVDKTAVMAFHHSNRPPPPLPPITLNSKYLSVVKKQRHLGVIFQHNLQWTSHIIQALAKAGKTLHMLRRLRSTISPEALVHLYKTYVRPILEYASIVTTPLSQTLMDKLERFRRRAARICLRVPLFNPVNHSLLLHKLSLPSLFCRRKLKHILFIHSIHHKYAPPHILAVSTSYSSTPYQLRHSRIYHLPTSHTDRHRDSQLHAAMYYLTYCLALLLKPLVTVTC